MDPRLLKELNAARQARKAAVLVTSLEDGRSRLVVEGEAIGGDLGEEVTGRLRSGKSGSVEVDGRPHFLNVYLPPPRIVVIGAVHISQALYPMARIAGFDLTIIDPRTAFATAERFAGANLVADWPEDALKARPLDGYTALAALTHDPKIDDYPIAMALKSGCFYVGALGSRKTHGKRVERLKAEGFGDGEIARISAPIGLDIGAATPGEIAVAILADIIQAFRRRELGQEGTAG
ncbi:putative sulfurylase large subunit (molybdopterin cytosine dinucleotide biosynthesis) [Ciceribacter lividus]|uniref:Putative sulfurylase large subunit (Molybdopterin cytosine dinucleotide biosynthesis) n=1 Tax=Ciceribacter lividus TaxID=1197950 RepID=A0A6I7HT44_9HYPH|nr:XdhC family protein [Ciceribacter lividus]RCW28580.1 putative sulfurylase large subunit (molybdopterin cytosine dinucleotide biosynthesis) [Ciceribacter lividus]